MRLLERVQFVPKLVGRLCAKIKMFHIGAKRRRKAREKATSAPPEAVKTLKSYIDAGVRRSFGLRR